MSLTFVFGFAFICIILIVIFKKYIVELIRPDQKLVILLKRFNWFQDVWFGGLLLFGLNAILFFLTILLILLVTYLLIPFAHLLMMLIAVVGSIFVWSVINRAWEGSKQNRMKMGLIGSSFYLMMTLIFGYQFITLKPSHPGEDLFMAAFGLMIGIVITAVAFITCFMYTGLTVKNNED